MCHTKQLFIKTAGLLKCRNCLKNSLRKRREFFFKHVKALVVSNDNQEE